MSGRGLWTCPTGGEEEEEEEDLFVFNDTIEEYSIALGQHTSSKQFSDYWQYILKKSS